MRELRSFAEAALHVVTLAAGMAATEQKGLEAASKLVEKTAKGEFGRYQPDVGPFPGWPELADRTKDDRVAQGYTENDPLLRSGELRDAVTHHVEPGEAIIGVPVGPQGDKMVWQELGTERMPARPVLGPAAFRNRENIARILGAAVVSGLIGADVIHKALGYDFRTKD